MGKKLILRWSGYIWIVDLWLVRQDMLVNLTVHRSDTGSVWKARSSITLCEFL